MKHSRRRFATIWLIAGWAACAPAGAQDQPSAFDLTIEELGRLRVTSVSRRAENLNETSAAIFVITAEDIRRSGVTTFAEALRLAPGVEVARNGSSEWTISIRGFSSDLSNKLLVLIDGRSVYSPLFAGVFWDVQDTLLADVERIEVVSGPGGAVWGSNAVNGVINIITHSAADTQGGFAEIGAGNEEEVFGAVRYGWEIGEKIAARAYVKSFERDAAELPSGGAAFDSWNMTRGGFALAWEPTVIDVVNVRADVYDGEESALLRGDFTLGTLPGPETPGVIPLSGHSVMANWRRNYATDANWGLQFYYDHTDRQIPGSFDEARDTFNLAFLHDVANRGRHDVQWGVDLRSTSDQIGNTLFATFNPDSRTDQTISAFVQDRIDLHDGRVFLTLGTKLEHNDYTGFEQQPNVRITWLPGIRQTVWAAVSEAVRVPARLNNDLRLYAPVAVPGLGLPLYINVNGTPNFESEELTAYEVGYRVQLRENWSIDLALFDNYYDHLQTQEASPLGLVPGPPAYFLLPATLANLMEGESYGGTVIVNWQAAARWRLQLQYAHLQIDLASKPGSSDTGAVRLAGNSPKNHVTLQSFVELPRDLSLYTSIRHVDELPSLGVPSYLTVDWTLAWLPTDKLRVSFTLQSANDARRMEFNDGRLIERSAFARLAWTF